ncbi:site-specific integrase [Streptacidiphilus sp. PB12-B1b]|uniref:tyrosine-type recombinase/integrase n=1 Tax=Streptacidiphilus sp. PB12-B1b TaxID=2705012 RepID=UPI0015FB2113|nr:site-specific integrase [Streptacidiphilus sp. PB12-B1b]QMU74870.1 site-specific integrase [Streptacidiphilus sp. PB12-B1b]
MTTPDTNPTTGTGSRRVRANGDGTVYQRKDGRWEAAGYVLAAGHTRRRIHVYATTRKEALAQLTEKVATSNRGIAAPSAQGSVAAFLTYWLETVAVHRLRENTHTRYTACVRLYVIPGLGKKKLAKLTTKEVRTWLDRLRTTCQCCARSLDAARDQPQCCAAGICCRKRLSPLTLAYVHSVLKSALEHAVREEEIPRNVARNVRMGIPRPRRFEPFTAEEAGALLTATSRHRLSALFELALRTGLRKGELLGLRWEDLDLTGGSASIRRTLQRTNSAGLTALPTKTRSSERRIALPTECLHSLEQHRERQAQECEAAGAGWKASGYVFTRPDGSPIEGATLTRHFNALLRRAALRRIRFHDLRHSAATLLPEQGVELVVIKELLGHALIGVTATVYAHVRLRLQRDAIDLLGNALRNPVQPDARPDDGDEPPVRAAPVH